MAAVVDLTAQGFLPTGGSELSAHLLEAIEHEADAELERHAVAVRFETERHDDAMCALTEMRRLAEALSGPQPVALPAPEVVEGEAEEVRAIDPPPPAAIPIAGRGPAAARAREERVLEALRAAGEAIVPQLADATALTVPQVRGALRRLESQVPPLARPTGEKIGISRNGGGRPSEVWEPVDPDTEPEGDDAENLVDPEPAAPTSRELAGEADRAARAAKQADKENGDHQLILTALEAGDRTVAELQGELALTSGRISGILIALSVKGRVERRGERDKKSLWRRRPLPHEQEDVVCRTADGQVTEVHVLECLRNGTSTILEIARELEATAGDVALEMSKLERAGRVGKIAGGKYQLAEAAA